VETVYKITVDEGGMDWQQAGPLFERYSVNLVGSVDRRWVDCYAKLTKERPNLARYRLEAATTSVSFTCRSTDGPAEVMGVLHRLQEMVELVNQAATAAVRAEQEQSKVKPHPAAKAEGSTAASLAAGLFARLSRR
jgi:hypothetical protein